MTIRSLGLLGCGNMGEALLKGALFSLPDLSISVLEKSVDRAQLLRESYPSINTLGSYADLGTYDAIIIAVKPQQFAQASEQLREGLSSTQVIISIAAGITLSTIQKAFPDCECVRVMPNTPALIGKGMTGLSFGVSCPIEIQNFVRSLFSSIGDITTIPETLMNALTAISGSGPAYFYHFIDVLATQSMDLGFSYDEAKKLLTQTMLGSAIMLQQSDKSPTDLIRHVTSPGGTTEAAMKILVASDLGLILNTTLQAAKNRADELSRS